MILDVVTGKDNKILHTKAAKIAKITPAIKKLAKNMIDTMNDKNGIGIAGPQVGEMHRIIIVRLNSGTAQEQSIAMINPEITHFSEDVRQAEEGCLSLPGEYGQVFRSVDIDVTYTTVKGETRNLFLQDLNARIVQHEVDHLDGILFPERIEEQMKDKDIAF